MVKIGGEKLFNGRGEGLTNRAQSRSSGRFKMASMGKIELGAARATLTKVTDEVDSK